MIIAKIFTGLALIAVASIILLLWAMFADQSTFSSGLSTYGDLPPTATDIAVYENRDIGGLRLIELKISEEQLRSYAESQDWSLREIAGLEHIMSANAFHHDKANSLKTISDGLFFQDRRPNGGGVTIAFNRLNQVAYINSSSK